MADISFRWKSIQHKFSSDSRSTCGATTTSPLESVEAFAAAVKLMANFQGKSFHCDWTKKRNGESVWLVCSAHQPSSSLGLCLVNPRQYTLITSSFLYKCFLTWSFATNRTPGNSRFDYQELDLISDLCYW